MPLHQDGSISPRNCLLATAKFGAGEIASKPFAKDQLSLKRYPRWQIPFKEE